MTDPIVARIVGDAGGDYPGVITPKSAIHLALHCSYVVRMPLTVVAREAAGSCIELIVIIPGFPDGSPERRRNAFITRQQSTHDYTERCRTTWVELRDILNRSQYKREQGF